MNPIFRTLLLLALPILVVVPSQANIMGMCLRILSGPSSQAAYNSTVQARAEMAARTETAFLNAVDDRIAYSVANSQTNSSGDPNAFRSALEAITDKFLPTITNGIIEYHPGHSENRSAVSSLSSIATVSRDLAIKLLGSGSGVYKITFLDSSPLSFENQFWGEIFLTNAGAGISIKVYASESFGDIYTVITTGHNKLGEYLYTEQSLEALIKTREALEADGRFPNLVRSLTQLQITSGLTVKGTDPRAVAHGTMGHTPDQLSALVLEIDLLIREFSIPTQNP